MKPKESLKDKVLETISKEQVTPKKKWEFVLKEYGIWFVAGGAFLLGAIATSVIIELTEDGDWALHNDLGISFIEHLWKGMPILWIIVAVMLIVVADSFLRKSKKGYKAPLVVVIVGSLICMGLFGVFFHAAGFGEQTDQYFEEHIGPYARFQPHNRLWGAAREGRLGGTIIEIQDEEHFLLADPSGQQWSVEVEADDDVNSDLVEGKQIKMIGEVKGEHEFEAEHIFSVMGPPGMKEGPFPKPPPRNHNVK